MSSTTHDPVFTGRLVLRGERGFEQARVGPVFNARRPGRQPAAVLLAETADDVVAGVKLARQRDWLVSVRSGGHSWAAWSVRQDCLLIDLAGLREIDYDAAAGIVRVSPAVRGGNELNPALVPEGVFFPSGHCPTVGLGGFLLQGGMGWNCRGWGWACERIVAVDVVTASGELVRADENHNTDLFWAARGAGPGFPGIVVRFHLAVRPYPRALTQSTLVYPSELGPEVLHWAQSIQDSLIDTVEIVVLGLTPAGAPDTRQCIVVHGVAFENEPTRAAEVLAPLAQAPFAGAAEARELDRPTSLAEENIEQERQNKQGNRFAVDNAWSAAGPEELTGLLTDLFTALPSRDSYTLWYGMGPLRPLPDMALSLQENNYLAAYVSWPHVRDDDRCRSWLERQMHRLEPVTTGQYLGDSDFTTRQLTFLGDAQFDRLKTIQAQRDPGGLFAGYLCAEGPATNRNHWQRTGTE
jgi:hypothetical protein